MLKKITPAARNPIHFSLKAGSLLHLLAQLLVSVEGFPSADAAVQLVGFRCTGDERKDSHRGEMNNKYRTDFEFLILQNQHFHKTVQ